MEPSGDVGVGVNEAASQEAVAGHGARGDRSKGGGRKAPSTRTGGGKHVEGREVCIGVDTGGAAGHTAVAGRASRGREAVGRREGRTSRRVLMQAWIVVVWRAEVVVRGVVDLEEVVEGRRLVELRARPLQKICRTRWCQRWAMMWIML